MDIRELMVLRGVERSALGSNPLQQNQDNQRPAFYAEGNARPDLVPPSTNLVGRFLAGAGIVGAVGAAIAYRKIPNADVAFSRWAEGTLSKFNIGRAATPLETTQRSGILTGIAGEIVNISRNSSDFSRVNLNKVLNQFSAIKPGLAQGETSYNIGQYLNDLAVDRSTETVKAARQLQLGLNKVAARSGRSLAELKAFNLDRNIVNVGGKAKDFRNFTPGGMLGRGLEWAHQNVRVPFTTFAPTDVFLHTAWANKLHSVVLSPATRVGGKELGEQAIAFRDKIITASGREIKGHNIPIRERTALAASAHVTRGEVRQRSIEQVLDEGDLEWPAKLFTGIQLKLRNLMMPTELVNRLQLLRAQGKYKEIEELVAAANPAFNNMMISPMNRRESSIARNIRIWFQKLAYGIPKLRPGVKEEDLTAIDKIARTLKWQSSKFQYLREGTVDEVIGEGVSPLLMNNGRQAYAPFAVHPQTANAPFNVRPGQQIANTHTIIQEGELGRTLANFFLERPTRLLENLLGIGITPTGSVGKTAAYNMVLAPLAVVGAWQAVQYMNFLTGGVPAKATAAVVGTGEVGIGAARDITGITPAANVLETVLPGSVNSFASQLIRGVGLPIAGAMLGKKYIPDIHLAGLGLSEKIASNAVRGGVMSGGMTGAIAGAALGLATTVIDPTKSSVQLYKEATGEAKVPVKAGAGWVAGRTPYEGDRTLYYDYSLVNKLWNYDAKDQLTYGGETGRWMHSWFPTPSNLFGAIPLLDPYHVEKRNEELRPYPTISAAGGNIPIIGPAVQGTIGELIKPSVTNSFSQPEGLYGPGGGAETLGFESQGSNLDPRGGGSVSANMNRLVNNMQDYSGIFGFMSRFPLKALTGSDTGITGEMEYASSSQMTDPGMAFEEMNFAGGFGTTELLRRYVNTPPNNVNYYNPLPNSAPSWLPGKGSMFEGDQEYHVDFHTGDMYGKDKGQNLEYRLPGAGYAARGMHGGGALDYADIYSILSDVAPGSQAHSYYKGMMEQAITQGVADSSAMSIYEQREKENTERLKGKYRFSDYPLNPTVSNTMGDEMKAYLGYVNVNIANNSIPGVNILQQAWATATHTQVPGLAWAQGKFMHNRTPLEEYVSSNVTGTEFANWADPIGAFVKPASYQMFDAVTPGQFVPGEVSQRWALEEYYDKLAYVKAKRLERIAREQGQAGLASQFQTQSEQTMAGLPLDPRGFNTNVFKATPQYMRPFVAPFALATPGEADKIAEVLPPYMQNSFNQAWNVNLGRNSPVQTDADAEVADYFATHALPTKDSAIWNPNVSIDEYKLKTFESAGQEYFNEGIPETKAREYRALGRADILLDGSSFGTDMAQRNALYEELRTDPSANSYSVTNSNIPRTNRISYSNPNKQKEYSRDRSNARF